MERWGWREELSDNVSLINISRTGGEGERWGRCGAGGGGGGWVGGGGA